MRAAKTLIRRALYSTFRAGQHFGFDLLPRHFYSDIPDLRELRKGNSWKLPRTMAGVNGADCDEQLAFVRDCCPPDLSQSLVELQIIDRACSENGARGYGTIEADFLYCLIRSKRPRRVVQIGAGISSSVILRAAESVPYVPELICIDPYPTKYLVQSAEARKITLIPEKAQEVDLSILTDLGAGDLFFIDSTHTTKPGSEVNRIILDVLPRLPSGCRVHFHDINFPYDYQPNVMESFFFWGETVLLHAFLTQNTHYTIEASLSMLHHSRSRELGEILPNYRPALMDYGIRPSNENPFIKHVPTALYLRVL